MEKGEESEGCWELGSIYDFRYWKSLEFLPALGSKFGDIHCALGGFSSFVVSKHGDRKSPKDRVVGPLQFMAFLWLLNGGYETA